jgi:hypothetical protein
MDKKMRQLLLDRQNILVCMAGENGPEVAQRLQYELADVDEKIATLSRRQVARSADLREARDGAQF